MGREGLLTSAWYAALFFAFGAHLPYWPVWLRDWGLSQGEIGSYLGGALVVRVVASIALPLLADRFTIRRAMIAAAGLAAAAIFVAHLFIEARPVLFAATLATAVATAPLIPLGEALGIRASARHGFAYAHARAIGSIAFLVMNVGLGVLLARFGTGVVLWAVALNLALVAALGAVHPGGGAPPGAMTDRASLREAAGLLRQPVFLTFIGAAGIGQASHAVYYAYGSLTWLAQGVPAEVIGLLWATGVVAEIALLLGPGRRLIARIGPARALAAAAAAGVVRWALMSLEPAQALLWPVQALHALTFAVGHLGAIAFVAAAIPPRLQATAQGIYGGGISGLAIALATLLAGWISEAHGIASAYWLAAAMSAMALMAALRLALVWDGGPLDPAQT
ncbi:MAG TPA: MFS transporter [Thermohalobaculum sp.]|nr:MFS transporter [Thermohalobaculum sp.]